MLSRQQPSAIGPIPNQLHAFKVKVELPARVEGSTVGLGDYSETEYY